MVSKAWLIGYANHRIRHINLYRNASSIERLATQLPAMKDEEDNQEKTGWLMTVEFVTGSTNQLVKKEKFLVYPKNSKAIDALSAMVGSVVSELIAANSDASYRINLQQTEPLVEVAMTKELLDKPVYYETDDWRCAKLFG
jgi:hypothetical protein